jgi:hypothetical protein
MTDFDLSFEDRRRLAEEMGVSESDVTAETLGGYIEELREYGRASEAARLIHYLPPGSADAMDDSPAEEEWRAFEVALGLADGPSREYRDDSEEARAFRRFPPLLGLPPAEDER